MRRKFILQMLFSGFTYALLPKAEKACVDPQQSHSLGLESDLLGKWHLLNESADENNIPQHRMEFLFKQMNGRLIGAIINRNSGDEIPLAWVKFNNEILTLQMQAPESSSQEVMPTLTMTASGNRFKGSWADQKGNAIGPRFKLIKAKS